ncbi:MAG: N-acetylmuramoyl-L-alanine amidase [Clostridiales bacterium]|jgi:N-acetylmuramoyl-L-alanine amidase|nr:N-acetylmuramoyl-L-alanine amidase [Clostridiales bacterium]
MKKYRGIRGKRNYISEANELKKPAKILCALCALILSIAGALFASAHFFVPGNEAEIPVFAIQNENIFDEMEIEYQEDKPPIIPINWEEEIFFDTYLNRLIFPKRYFVFEQTYNREFTISFDNVNFSRRYFQLLPYGILPMYILIEGSQISVRTRIGVFAEAGETETHSYIQFVDPRETYHTIVVLDAGHGGSDSPGASSVHGRNAPNEAQINLAISEKVFEIFDAQGILLLPTRTDDSYRSPASRTRMANELADYFISIHCNDFPSDRNASGTLTLYGTADGSIELAEIFQNALVAALGSNDGGLRYSPQFHLTRESNIPVIILELLFLSNRNDATRLADPETQMLIAETIAKTIQNLPPAR